LSWWQWTLPCVSVPAPSKVEIMPLLRAAAAFPCEMGQAKTNPVARLNALGDRASANRPPLISLPLEGSKFK
jgi:hypothetical protein